MRSRDTDDDFGHRWWLSILCHMSQGCHEVIIFAHHLPTPNKKVPALELRPQPFTTWTKALKFTCPVKLATCCSAMSISCCCSAWAASPLCCCIINMQCHPSHNCSILKSSPRAARELRTAPAWSHGAQSQLHGAQCPEYLLILQGVAD